MGNPDMHWNYVIYLFLLYLTNVCDAGKQCYYGYASTYSTYGSYTSLSLYCDVDCCGEFESRYCCNTKTAGVVIGAVIGGIAAVVVITFIVCWIKNKKGRGQVRNNAPPNKPVIHQVNQPVIHQVSAPVQPPMQGYGNPYGPPAMQNQYPPPPPPPNNFGRDPAYPPMQPQYPPPR